MMKGWLLPHKTGKKERISALNTSIQHGTGSLSQCSKARKGNKRHTDYIKEKIKLSLLADDRLKIHV